ncbi:MAG: DUF1049 domain-containing protein [Bacteroidales bacterium]|nr:DUF1049 domain-containing protein [Bacteroidales bacterium]
MERVNIKLIINIVLILVLLIFIGQNVESIRVKFLFFSFELPLIVLIGSVFFIGFFTAKLIPFVKNKKPDINKDKENNIS